MSFFNTGFLVASLSHCKVLQQSDFPVEGVGIDARKDLKNKVFVAIKGHRFDGHDFLSLALNQGAKAFIVSDLEKSRFLLEHKNVSLFLVPDTVAALVELARSWRKKQELQVIGITGSNGKTSVCSFTKTLLSDLSPFVSPKSYNNAIGVSLSLLSVLRKKAWLIQEIGTSQPGEIAFLTELCQPDISVVTMVGASHLEGLKSLDGVAKEKKNIYLKKALAVGVFNKDNPWTKSMAEDFSRLGTQSTVFSFSSKEPDANVSLKIIKQDKDSFKIQGRIGDFKSTAVVPLFGKESLENLMCASTIALAVGIAPKRIWDKLPECHNPKGRQEKFILKEKDISICFDAYNANPTSMDFFLDYCEKSSLGKNRLLVLGDMKELGCHTEKYHKDLAFNKTLLSSRGVFFVGEQGFLMAKELKKNQYQGIFKAFKAYSPQLSCLLKEQWQKGDFIGIKASRSLALEQLFFDLTGKKIF